MGVTVETTKEGDKKTYPKPGDSVTMDYTGTLEDGTVGCGLRKKTELPRVCVTNLESCRIFYLKLIRYATDQLAVSSSLSCCGGSRACSSRWRIVGVVVVLLPFFLV